MLNFARHVNVDFFLDMRHLRQVFSSFLFKLKTMSIKFWKKVINSKVIQIKNKNKIQRFTKL